MKESNRYIEQEFSTQIEKMPNIIQVEVTNRCNLNCQMCMRSFHNLRYEDMEFSKYKIIINCLPNSVKMVTLTGWGEPLFHPQICKMVSYAHKKGLITWLSTNATLLNRENQRKLLNAKLDFLNISMESLSQSDNSLWFHPYAKDMVRNIKSLVRYRGNKVKPYIAISVTLHKGMMGNVLEIVAFAQRLGIEAVYLSKLNSKFRQGLEGCSDKEGLEIWRRCIQLKKKGKPLVYATYFQFLMLKKIHNLKDICPRIYNMAYINIDGKITPCCILPKYEVGDIFKEALAEIWHSRSYTNFRKEQKRICSKICNIFEEL